MSETKHVPDIMEVITDLSNDEVRTPPRIANQVLDLLPDEVWTNSTYRWLDPGTKSGVFLREATKRLMIGLKSEFPDEQERLEHILQNQMFGLAITDLSGLMARRALYCSKHANSEESVVNFSTINGNIWHGRTNHPFKNQRCTECGANQKRFGSLTEENYAYAFIHKNGQVLLEKEFGLKFDVIVGNPPYQIEADAAGQNIVPIYDSFVQTAISLNPKYISMIIPSRWMAGGMRLDRFREQILTDPRMSKIVDYPNANELFPQVEIKGGVCYFLWDSNHSGPCATSMVRSGKSSDLVLRPLGEFDIFVRDPQAIPILKKVLARSGDRNLGQIITTRDPFGPKLPSNLKDYRTDKDKKADDILCYLNLGTKRITGWVDPQLITKNKELISGWKILLPKAGSDGGQKIPDPVIGKPLIAQSNSVCTMTYLVAGPLNSKEEAESLESYLYTKFARFLISLRKISQNTTSSVYAWVPLQKWDRCWTDSELFESYGITDQESSYINQMIKDLGSE